MYELLLPKRARPAYRHSRHKERLDTRAETLLACGYLPETVGRRLVEWVDFVQEYEEGGAALPTYVRSPEVVAYLDRRCVRRKEGHRQIRGALRLLLHAEGAKVRRISQEHEPTTPLFDEYVPGYLSFAQQHKGCWSSRPVEQVLRDFFAWIDGRRIEEIQELAPDVLRDFIPSRQHLGGATVSRYASTLRVFLRYLGMRGVVAAGLAMAVESPRRYRMSAPPHVLDEGTVQRLLEAVERTTPLGKRNYAMLLLAARYGLRPCDIRGLRIDDIHWREQRIDLVQSKTQCPLELPLLAEVDEALVDYLRNGRPPCDAREVFVRHHAPVAPFVKTNNLWHVIQRAFKAAGIEPRSGCRGFYLLRHSAATRMLNNGAPFDTISDVLGHASVDTTRIYAQVDLAGLRSVALSAVEVCP